MVHTLIISCSGLSVCEQRSIWAVLSLEVSTLLQAPKAVLGPGTGLGEAIMVFERSFGGYR